VRIMAVDTRHLILKYRMVVREVSLGFLPGMASYTQAGLLFVRWELRTVCMGLVALCASDIVPRVGTGCPCLGGVARPMTAQADCVCRGCRE
jgi:hypothetical protein